MNIAIDVMPNTGYGGITYLRNLLPKLEQREDDCRWFVYARKVTLEKIRFPSKRVVFREVKVYGGFIGSLFVEHLLLPIRFRKDRIDVVYAANNCDLFLAPRPRVIAVRNVEPFVYQDYFNSWKKRLRCAALGYLSRWSLRSADRVVTVSEYAQQVAAEGDDEIVAKSVVIPHGIGEPFSPGRERPSWAPERYIFTSARMIGYSNLHTLIEAYGICRKRGMDCPLLIAGGGHDPVYERRVKTRIKSLGIEADVRFLGYVDRETMAGLMPNATVFVFGSLLEACPNTLLEALRSGSAVVASATKPNREFGADSVVWCDGTDPLAMANAIHQVVTSESYSRILRRKAVRRAALYSWESTADSLVRLLKQVHGDSQMVMESELPQHLAARIRGS